jgi:hypothetical protein
MVLLELLALYALIGGVTALGFISFGLAAVLPPHTPVTLGARLLFLPAAVALWPLVIGRWLRPRPAS